MQDCRRSNATLKILDVATQAIGRPPRRRHGGGIETVVLGQPPQGVSVGLNDSLEQSAVANSRQRWRLPRGRPVSRHGPTGHDQGQATAPASSYVALCSPAVPPLAPHWRKHSRTQVGYVLVVVTHGLGHLHARVKTDRRFNGLVAKQTTHDLVATRVVS